MVLVTVLVAPHFQELLKRLSVQLDAMRLLGILREDVRSLIADTRTIQVGTNDLEFAFQPVVLRDVGLVLLEFIGSEPVLLGHDDRLVAVLLILRETSVSSLKQGRHSGLDFLLLIFQVSE